MNQAYHKNNLQIKGVTMKRNYLLMGVLFLALAVFVKDGSAKMTKISIGKKVTMDYITKIDGQVVETTTGKQPIVFIMGDGQVIPGLAKKLEGLKKGDVKVIHLKPKEGFGEVIEEAVHEFPVASFPQGTQFVVGGMIQVQGPNDQPVAGIVKNLVEDKVTIDFNHPFAGKDLDIEIKIVNVE